LVLLVVLASFGQGLVLFFRRIDRGSHDLCCRLIKEAKSLRRLRLE